MGSFQRLGEKAGHDQKKVAALHKLLRAPKRLATRSGEILATVAANAAPSIFKSLKARGPAMLADRRAMFAGFEERLYRQWRRPLDLLEMLIVICAETGETVSDRWPWKESKDQDVVFEVVRRLQARACQVASEILALLRSGYAPAAHARWRTLHETAVTASFIEKHGKDAAERFLTHEHVEARKAARQYQRYSRKLGVRRYSRKELGKLRSNFNALVKHYGPEFKDDYGWAAVTLGRKRATFADIEKAARFDHIRPYYKMASYPVHATVKSIYFSLALRDGQDLLLTGPSDIGLGTPGHSAAISLMQTTIVLLAMWPTSDSISLMHVLLLFSDEIGDTFLEADRRLRRRGGKSRTKTR
jgi:hypothetical protein